MHEGTVYGKIHHLQTCSTCSVYMRDTGFSHIARFGEILTISNAENDILSTFLPILASLLIYKEIS